MCNLVRKRMRAEKATLAEGNLGAAEFFTLSVTIAAGWPTSSEEPTVGYFSLGKKPF